MLSLNGFLLREMRLWWFSSSGGVIQLFLWRASCSWVFRQSSPLQVQLESIRRPPKHHQSRHLPQRRTGMKSRTTRVCGGVCVWGFPVMRWVYLCLFEVVSIPAGGSLMDSASQMDFLPGFNLEGFPNRDSTKYAEPYGIQTAHTLIRGTLRFKVSSPLLWQHSCMSCVTNSSPVSFPQGFSKAMSGFVKLGLINAEPSPILKQTSAHVSWVRSLVLLPLLIPSSSCCFLKLSNSSLSALSSVCWRGIAYFLR